MSLVSPDELTMAEAAVLSAVRKNEKTLRTLQGKASPPEGQMKLVRANLSALQSGLAALRRAMGQDVPPPDRQAAAASAETLSGLARRVDAMVPKYPEGTSQHTLAVRRVRAFDIAAELLKQELQ